jgi:hypothetical protein
MSGSWAGCSLLPRQPRPRKRFRARPTSCLMSRFSRVGAESLRVRRPSGFAETSRPSGVGGCRCRLRAALLATPESYQGCRGLGQVRPGRWAGCGRKRSASRSRNSNGESSTTPLAAGRFDFRPQPRPARVAALCLGSTQRMGLMRPSGPRITESRSNANGGRAQYRFSVRGFPTDCVLSRSLGTPRFEADCVKGATIHTRFAGDSSFFYALTANRARPHSLG